MELLRKVKTKKTKNKNGENVPHIEFTEAALVHRNIIISDYQQDSTVLYIFVSNKSSGQL